MAGPEPDALRRVRVRGERQEAVPTHAMGQPDAVVAERLRAVSELGRGGKRFPRGQERGEAMGRRHEGLA